MSRCSDGHALRALIAALLPFALSATVHAQAPAANPTTRTAFGFGTPASARQIAGWDIDVRPDGAGLPPGKGSVAQGQGIYDEKCASCHGTFGESTDYLPLAGGVGSLSTAQPVRTTGSKLNYATTLFDYIRRAMPFTNPQTLSTDEVYALTAYVLNLNDIIPPDATLDQESLPKVKMPNREGFTTAHGFMRSDGKPDTRNVACMTNCAKDLKLSSEMPDYARDSHGNLAEQSRPSGAVEGVVTVPVAARAAGTSGTSPARELAQRSGCLACHGTTARVVGPALRDIAAKYAGNPKASALLLAKVKSGGAGVWGAVPMPAQPQLKDADAAVVIDWILAGAQ